MRGGFGAEVVVHAALHDAEPQLMAVQRLFAGDLLPAFGHGEGFFGGVAGAGVRRAFVERHHDVGAEVALDAHGLDRAEEMPRAVDVRGELDAVRLDLAERGEAEDLESAAVGQDGVVPVLELVQAAGAPDQPGARTEHQVVGVPEDDLDIQLLQFARGHRLHRGARADRHEDRGMDRAVGGLQHAEARVRRFGTPFDCEAAAAHGRMNIPFSTPCTVAGFTPSARAISAAKNGVAPGALPVMMLPSCSTGSPVYARPGRVLSFSLPG